MSPRNPGFEEATKLLDELVCQCGHRSNQHDPEDARCDSMMRERRPTAYSPLEWVQEPCSCRCFKSPDPNLTTNEYRLTALLDAKQTEPCPTCGGAETVRCVDPGCEPEDGDRHEHFVECPDCTDGRVPGTVPLVLLAPIQIDTLTPLFRRREK